jgi:hypothetical protein
VGNGLRGSAFWIVTEHGYAADYVKNIQADPRVRIKLGPRWLSGTARILPDDPPYERLRWLARPLNDVALLGLGTEQLVIRVDLDDPPAGWPGASRAAREAARPPPGGGSAGRPATAAGG